MPALSRIKPVALALVVLIHLNFSGNLTAKPSAAEDDSQKNVLVERFDRSLIEARKLQSKGDYKGALAALATADDLAKELQNAAGILSVLIQQSDLYLNVGQIEQARELGQQALNLARELENQPALMASALNNWGTLLVLERDYKSAIEAFNQGLELAKAAKNPSLATRILSNLAKSATYADDLSMAKKALYESADLVEELPPSRRKTLIQSALATQLQDLLERDDPPSPSAPLKSKVWNLWEAVKAQADSSADTRSQSNAYGHIARLHEMEEDYGPALQKTRQALFFCSARTAPGNDLPLAMATRTSLQQDRANGPGA